MSIFSDFIEQDDELKNKFKTIKPDLLFSGLYPKGDPRYNTTGGLDPMPTGLINKISRVPVKLK